METVRVEVTGGCSIAVDLLEGVKEGFLLVHGLASNARMWDGLAKELNKVGYKVAILDQRGHGRSDKPATGYDFETITGDLAKVVEFLISRDWTPPVVVGQSWGGAVVESFAAYYPHLIKGVVAVDGGFTSLAEFFPTWEECDRALAPPNLLGIPWDNFENMIKSSHPDWPDTGIQGVLGNMERLSDDTVRPWLSRENHLQILRNLWQHNPFELCSRIDAPILFIPATGKFPDRDRDKLEGLNRLTEIAKLSKVIPFDPADHDIHAQYPKELSKLLIDEITTGIFS